MIQSNMVYHRERHYPDISHRHVDVDIRRLYSPLPLGEQLLSDTAGRFHGEGYMMAPDRTPAELRQLLLDSSEHFHYIDRQFLKHITDYAILMHGKDLRKDGKTLYSNHPLRVALHLDTPLKRAIAVAHDLQEDKEVTQTDLYEWLHDIYGYQHDVIEKVFFGIDTVSTKYVVIKDGKKEMRRKIPKRQGTHGDIEKEKAHYNEIFAIDREFPELGLAELKMFDRRDSILSDIIILLNKTSPEQKQIREDARERLRGVLSKTEPFLEMLKAYKPELAKLLDEAMRLGNQVLRTHRT